MDDPASNRDHIGQHILTAAGTFKSVKSTAWLLAILFALLAVLEAYREGDWGTLAERVPVLFLIWGVAVFLVRGIVQLMRVSVYTGGLQGRSWWGFRTRIPWDEIRSFRYDNASGIAAIVVESETRKDLWLLREVGERDAFQQAVAPYFDWRGFLEAGPWASME